MEKVSQMARLFNGVSASDGLRTCACMFALGEQDGGLLAIPTDIGSMGYLVNKAYCVSNTSFTRSATRVKQDDGTSLALRAGLD